MQFSKVFLSLVAAASTGLAAPAAVEKDTASVLVDRQVDLHTCLNGLVGLGAGVPLCLSVLCPCVNSLPALGGVLAAAGITC